VRHDITLDVNGEHLPLQVEANDLLLDVLRTRAGVKSPKIGCERGDCGTCTILLDGRCVRSCLILAVEADGHQITTVEGIGRDGLTELQQTLVDRSAFQCGFCAPGIVLATHELLQRTAHPTRRDVQEAISGNLCRCTGYAPIIDAVLEAADHERTTTAAATAPRQAASQGAGS
jgi:carbon-monoxide dehydrogenase small subunit